MQCSWNFIIAILLNLDLFVVYANDNYKWIFVGEFLTLWCQPYEIFMIKLRARLRYSLISNNSQTNSSRPVSVYLHLSGTTDKYGIDRLQR